MALLFGPPLQGVCELSGVGSFVWDLWDEFAAVDAFVDLVFAVLSGA